jgi:putative tryptophan/tyrosine transport system substrate-binding protein
MKRREFLGVLGGAAAFPLGARAQRPKMVRIGILNSDNPEPLLTMLREGLREFGYIEGQNLQVEFRSADGNPDRLAGLAGELLARNIDVLVAYQTPGAVAAKQATREIPIVLLGNGDPVGTGLIANLARPGGNITGTSSQTSENGSKMLEVMRDIMPSVLRVAVLVNTADPFSKSFLNQIQLGGKLLNVEIESILIKAPEELDSAFVDIKKNGADALIVQPSLPRSRVADLALNSRIPAISPTVVFARLGGLAGYSASQKEIGRSTAAIIDKILKGSKPADLPVQQPTTFELTINLKTAKALGITIPPTLLARADEVIE